MAGCANYGEKIEVNKGETYYTEGVQKADAEKLANDLKEQGYFDGQEKSVQLNKTGDRFEPKLVVKPEAANSAEIDAAMKPFAEAVSKDVFNGTPVTLHTTNEKLKTIKTY